MTTYCVKFRTDTESIHPKIVRAKNNRLIMQSKCSVCGIKKSRFVKEQEAPNPQGPHYGFCLVYSTR